MIKIEFVEFLDHPYRRMSSWQATSRDKSLLCQQTSSLLDPNVCKLSVYLTSPYLRIVDPASECLDFPIDPAIIFPFELDPFQKHAIAAIRRDENVLITAKTSSGKTTPAIYQIAHSLAKGRRVFYTTPIKSLSNQKFHELNEIYPGRVSLATGDIRYKPDAEIIVMTTEILRNLLYKKGSSTETVGLTAGMSLENLDAVVFDEVHYINNKERGKVWEETLILLPREVNLVMLSATVSSPEAFASWIGDLKKKPIHLISTTYRIVPLTHNVLLDGALTPIMDAKGHFLAANYTQWRVSRERTLEDHADHKRRVASRESGQVLGSKDGKVKLKSFTHQLNTCVKFLYDNSLLPALFFIFSRKDCERYAAQIEGSLVDPAEGAAIEKIFDFHLSRYKDTLIPSQHYHTLRTLLVRGIAFHHSGLQPILKEIIEILFGKGLLRVLFCTETFAVGINMPTKTVVYLSLKKYCDETQSQRILQPSEYIQMAGRAGRRGKDKFGTVIYLPRDEPAALEEVRKMMTGDSTTITSRMDFGYDFLLKTFLHNSDWKQILHDSYWYKQAMEAKASTEAELTELERKKTALGLTEEDITYFEKKNLMLYVDKNSRIHLQREVGEWENKHVGPKWKNIMTIYPQLTTQILKCERELSEYEADFEDGLIAPYMAFLKATGFMEEKVLPESDVTYFQSTGDRDADTTIRSTEKGRCATEINEAHPILLTEAYFCGWLSDLDPVELIGFLSVFCGDRGDAEESPSLAALRISDPLRSTFNHLKSLIEKCADEEKLQQIPYSDYWDINTYWVEIGLALANGSEMSTVCAEFGVYEGNLYKFVMSLNNILEELTAVATLRSDVTMLERLEESKKMLSVPGAIWGESLYLRL